MAWALLDKSAEVVAPQLLGSLLVREVDGQRLICRIVETEAYNQTDAASHSFRGRTPRTAVMFGPSGHLYVYFTYGMHYCMNVVCGPEGIGAAVLIRAIEPLNGDRLMSQNRGYKSGVEISNGPAKLCQALGIDKAMNGHDLLQAPLQLELKAPLRSDEIVQTTRVGIAQARNVRWRFYIRDNPYVSKP